MATYQIYDDTNTLKITGDGNTINIPKSGTILRANGNIVYIYNDNERIFYQLNYASVTTPSCASAELLRSTINSYLTQTVNSTVDTSLLATKANQTNGSQITKVSNQYLDAFGLLKVGQPANRLDSEFNYDKNEEIFDEILGAGGGTITHDADKRHLLLETGGTATNRSATMRSFPIPYTPGYSQGIDITGVLNYANIANGVAQVFLRSKVTGSVIEQVVNQADWNIDGASTVSENANINWSYSQIFDIDFQSLKVGRIRLNRVANGVPVACHEFCNDNIRNTGYWQNPCLPVYWRIYNDATYTYMEMGYGNESNAIGFRYRVPVNASATMTAICCTVKSGGGIKLFDIDGYPSAADMGVTAKTVGTSIIPLLSVRQRATFNSIENLSIAIPEEISVQTNNPIRLMVYHDSTLTGASWSNIDTNHSTIEQDITASAITGGHIVQSEYVATSKNINSTAKSLLGKSVLWYRQNGNSGILTLAAQRSDTTNANVLVSIKLKELR